MFCRERERDANWHMDGHMHTQTFRHAEIESCEYGMKENSICNRTHIPLSTRYTQLLIEQSLWCEKFWMKCYLFITLFTIYIAQKSHDPPGNQHPSHLGQTLSTQSHLTTCYASRHYKTGRVISVEGIAWHEQCGNFMVSITLMWKDVRFEHKTCDVPKSTIGTNPVIAVTNVNNKRVNVGKLCLGHVLKYNYKLWMMHVIRQTFFKFFIASMSYSYKPSRFGIWHRRHILKNTAISS